MAFDLEDLKARLTLDTSGFDSGLGKAESSLKTKGRSISSAGRSITTGLTAPLLLAGGVAVKMAADFDTTMRQVAIATGSPRKPLQDLALQMGQDTAFSAGEASDAMLDLAKGGMTAVQIQAGAMQATMTLAAAGNVELADAADYVSNSLHAFKLNAKDSNEVAVALAGGANASSASVQSLGLALSQSGQAAHVSGLDIHETVGALALFDQNSLKGSDAGTSFKNMLVNLVPQTDKAKKAMADLGLNFTDAQGDMLPLADVADQLHNKLGDLSESQRITALRTIFGNDAFRAANILLEAGSKGLDKYVKGTYDQATTTKLANVQMTGLQGSLERAQGSLETAAITAGTAMAPAVEEVAGTVEDLANKFASLSPDQQEFIVKTLAIVAAVGPALVVTGKLVTAVGQISGVLRAASGGLSSYAGSLRNAETRTATLARTAKFAAGAAGIGLLIASTQEADENISALEAGAGGAAIGSIFGPWGAVLGGAAGALYDLNSAMDDWTAKAYDGTIQAGDYTDAIDAATGAVNKQTRAQVAQTLQSNGMITAANQLGLSTRDLVSYTIGQEGASKRLAAQLSATRDRLIEQSTTGQLTAQQYTNQTYALDVLTDKLHLSRKDFADQRDAIMDNYQASLTWKQALDGIPKRVFTRLKNQDFEPTIGQIEKLRKQYDLTPKQVATILKATGYLEASSQVEKFNGSVTKIPNAARKAVEATQNAWQSVVGPLRRISTVAAQGMSQPIEHERVNMSPFERSVLGPLQALKGQAGVDGLGIGHSIGQGVSTGIGDTVSNIVAAAQNAVQQAINAAKSQADARSPSRKMHQIGVWLAEGLRDGLDEGTPAVKASIDKLKSLVSELADAKYKSAKKQHEYVQAFTKATRDEQKDLLTSTRAYDAAVAKVEKGEQRLTAAIQKRNAEARTIATGVLASGSVIASTPTDLTDADGNPVAATATNVIQGMRARVEAAEKFRKQLLRLRKEGLNRQTYKELLEAGPEAAGATVQALARGGQDAVNTINKLQGRLGAVARKLGDTGSRDLYQAGVDSARGLLKGLRANEAELRGQMRDLAKMLADSIREALGIDKGSRDRAANRNGHGGGGHGGPQGIAVGDGVDGKVQVTIHAPQLRSDEELGNLVGGRVYAAVHGRVG